MNEPTRRPQRRPQQPASSAFTRPLAAALALACCAGAATAGEGSALVTSFSYVVSGGTLSWLDPYQSFSATALDAGGVTGAKTDSYATADFGMLAVGANTASALAAVSTTEPQTFWADAGTQASTGAAGAMRNQGNATASQSAGFTLSQAGSVTFTVNYLLSAVAVGGNAVNDYASAFLHFNAANAGSTSGGDLSRLVNSFDTAAGNTSRSGSFTLTVNLAAGEQGFYTLDGSAVSFSPVTAVPEPGPWALLCAGLLATTAVVRRRRD